MVSTTEKYALEIEILDSGGRFRVAARKKGVFSGQYAGSLEEPTFSTESPQRGQSKAPDEVGSVQADCMTYFD